MQRGIGVSAGIAVAPAFLFRAAKLDVIRASVGDPNAECERFEKARLAVVSATELLRDTASEKADAASAEIFDAHCSLLADTFGMVEPICQLIREESCNAEWAVNQHMEMLKSVFESMDDEYMRQRAADIADLNHRLLATLLDVEAKTLDCVTSKVIVVAHDLTPSETVGLDTTKIAAFLLESGGATSHTAILSKSLGIPAVLGAGPLLETVEDGAQICLDGAAGEFMVMPDAATLADFAERARLLEQQRLTANAYRGRRTQTTDCMDLLLAGNAATPDMVASVLKNDAEGIGLLRSEFLYMGRDDLPDEETQFAAYRSVLEAMGEKPVIVRTLDIGGDKDVPYLHLPAESNPFLGCRAIRICLRNQELFRTQLRALLRASVYGNLEIMFPMISCLSELRAAKAVLQSVKDTLSREGIPYNQATKIGMMIKIPSAAVLADRFAKEVDFFSIGTNDLTQYTLAVDRGNDAISELYSPYHPSVIRLVAMTSAAAKRNGIPCGMCGEAASESGLIPVWIGLGLTELSVTPELVLETRRRVCTLSYNACQKIAEEVQSLDDPVAVQQYLRDCVRE